MTLITTLITTRARAAGGVQTFFDGDTFETTFAQAPVWFEDDFIGARGAAFPTAATPGEPWLKKLVHTAGTPSVTAVANAAGGQVACALDATAEKQDAVLYFGDSLTFDVTRGLNFETRVALAVPPSAAGVETVFGLQSAWADGPDTASYYLGFGAVAGGTILARSQDGVAQTSGSTGVTVAAGAFHIYRIDATDVTDVRFFVDGADVTPAGGVAFAATGAAAILQPYVSVYKPAGAAVAITVVDVVKVWTNRV